MRPQVPPSPQLSTSGSARIRCGPEMSECDHRAVQDGSLIPRFGRARRDPSLAVLEGFHPIKHALRFGANMIEVVSHDPAELDRLPPRAATGSGSPNST